MSFETGKRATLRDVARQVGVSSASASRALNGTGRESSELVARVHRAAEELGYQPNALAQRLKGRGTETVGILTLGLDLGVGTQTLGRLRELLAQSGYHAPVHTYGFAVERDEAEQLALTRELLRDQPRAIACNTSGMGERAFEALRRFRDEGGVLVCYGLSRPPFACDAVFFDEQENTFQAAQHLLQHGHTRLGFRHHGRQLHPCDRALHARLRGFERAHEEFGLRVRDEWIFEGAGIYEDGGAEMAAQFLALPRNERPTGMCIVNDVSASAFVNHLLRAKLRVPQDVSVIGTDDVPAAAHCIVPLTTVSQPVQQIAQTAFSMLQARLSGTAGEPQLQTVHGALIERDSCAPPTS